MTIDYGDADPGDPSSVSTTCVVSTGTPVVVGAGGAPSCELTQGPDPTVGTPGVVTSNFTYPRPGVFTVSVTVVDSAGNVVERASDDYLVVYDPDAGQVNGAGKFWSDPSSYAGSDGDGEWAHFGFKAKYKHQDPVPEGDTNLKLKKEFNFKSTSYDYLIINDTMAVAEGVGEIDNNEGYRFRVQGIDNGNTDFFQITIWEDGNPSNVIYDNGVIFDMDNGSTDGDEVLAGAIKIKS